MGGWGGSSGPRVSQRFFFFSLASLFPFTHTHSLAMALARATTSAHIVRAAPLAGELPA